MQTQAHFENIQAIIVQHIKSARKSIFVAVAWLTDNVIFNELCYKAREGVKVELVIVNDEINNAFSPVDHKMLASLGGKVFFVTPQIDGAIMHHKFCVVDDYIVITGSYNWSKKAQTNDENIVVIQGDTSLVNQYKAEFSSIVKEYHKDGNDIIKLDTTDYLVPCYLKNKPGKFGFSTPDFKKIVIPCEFDQVWPFKNGYAKVELGGLFGDRQTRFINRFGFIIEPAGSHIFDRKEFPEGITPASIGRRHALSCEKKYGFIDKNSDELVVIPFIYDDAHGFNESVASVKRGNRWGFISSSGDEVIPFKFGWGGDFYKGLVLVELNGKWGFINHSGREIIKCIYDGIYRMGDSLDYQIIELEKKKGYFDIQKHEIVIPIRFDDAKFFSESLAAVKLNGKWGFVNKAGQEVVSFLYDDAYNFSEGLCPVKLGNKWGVINTQGELVIPFDYLEISQFKDGKATICKTTTLADKVSLVLKGKLKNLQQKQGRIDRTGKENWNIINNNNSWYSEL